MARLDDQARRPGGQQGGAPPGEQSGGRDGEQAPERRGGSRTSAGSNYGDWRSDSQQGSGNNHEIDGDTDAGQRGQGDWGAAPAKPGTPAEGQSGGK